MEGLRMPNGTATETNFQGTREGAVCCGSSAAAPADFPRSAAPQGAWNLLTGSLVRWNDPSRPEETSSRPWSVSLLVCPSTHRPQPTWQQQNAIKAAGITPPALPW